MVVLDLLTDCCTRRLMTMIRYNLLPGHFFLFGLTNNYSTCSLCVEKCLIEDLAASTLDTLDVRNFPRLSASAAAGICHFLLSYDV